MAKASAVNSVGRRGLAELARIVARDVKTNDSLSTQEQGGTTPFSIATLG